ncbi:MAG: phosphoribosylanthranilate isomerase [Candidatus Omnitrophica bacterium]|nr:phosphoribosylanthranilate isomerase [Candidatus Omnitrophota bacterium]
MWVKICGITNLKDAQAAAAAGADALGFLFIPTSPRALERDQVARILPVLPPTVLPVAVVANESTDFLKGLLRVCPVGGIQFHGSETPEEVLSLKGLCRLFKAIRVKDEKSLEVIPKYQGVDAVLLDAYSPRRVGGTGEVFNWALADKAKAYGIPIVVAGGLNPGNVREAIQKAKPYGVDTASGVEIAAGVKDHTLVREFILRAKSG